MNHKIEMSNNCTYFLRNSPLNIKYLEYMPTFSGGVFYPQQWEASENGSDSGVKKGNIMQ
jgi:hypothetical protein